MTTSLALGVDGGGTKTLCVVMDAQQRLLGQAQVGSTNHHSIGAEGARGNLALAITSALADAGSALGAVGAICVGMSGVGRVEDRRLVQSWLHDLLPDVPMVIHSDAVIALASGTGGQLYGVVVISGTGMIVYGLDHEGREQRAGGWGALLGDPGGGYAIGSAILHAVTAAVDGYGPSTTLCDAVLMQLGFTHPNELIAWAYTDPQWDRIARLAPLASCWAERGDPVAMSIVDQASQYLTQAAHTVICKLQLDSLHFPLVLAGGNLAPGLLATKVRKRLASLVPQAELTRPLVNPATGAALLALNSLRSSPNKGAGIGGQGA